MIPSQNTSGWFTKFNSWVVTLDKQLFWKVIASHCACHILTLVREIDREDGLDLPPGKGDKGCFDHTGHSSTSFEVS